MFLISDFRRANLALRQVAQQGFVVFPKAAASLHGARDASHCCLGKTHGITSTGTPHEGIPVDRST
jgi:hypothetical protein